MKENIEKQTAENIKRAQMKLALINEQLLELKEGDCNSPFAKMSIQYINDELAKIMSFMNP